MAVVTRQFDVAFADAAKATVVQSGVLAAPVTQGIAITINEVDTYRQNEINTSFLQVRNRIIDDGLYESNTAATSYWYVPVGAGDAGVVLEPILGNIPDGVLVISLAGNFRASHHGSTIFQSMVGYCMAEMADNYLKLL